MLFNKFVVLKVSWSSWEKRAARHPHIMCKLNNESCEKEEFRAAHI